MLFELLPVLVLVLLVQVLDVPLILDSTLVVRNTFLVFDAYDFLDHLSAEYYLASKINNDNERERVGLQVLVENQLRVAPHFGGADLHQLEHWDIKAEDFVYDPNEKTVI